MPSTPFEFIVYKFRANPDQTRRLGRFAGVGRRVARLNLTGNQRWPPERGMRRMDGDCVAGGWLVKVAASLFPSVAKDRSQLPLSNRK